MDLVIVPIVIVNIVAAAVMAAIAITSRSNDDHPHHKYPTPSTGVSPPSSPATGRSAGSKRKQPDRQPAWTPGPSWKVVEPGADGIPEKWSSSSPPPFAFPYTRLELRSIVNDTGTDAAEIPVVPTGSDGSLLALIDLASFSRVSDAPRIEEGCRALLARMGKHEEPSSKMMVVAVDSLISLLPGKMQSSKSRWAVEAHSVSVVIALNDAWSTGTSDGLTFVVMLMSPKEAGRSVRAALAPWLGESRRMTARQVTEKMQLLSSLLTVAGPTRIMNAGADMAHRFVVALVAHITNVHTLGSAQALSADLEETARAFLAQLGSFPRPVVLIAVSGDPGDPGIKRCKVKRDASGDLPVSVDWAFDPHVKDNVRVWCQYPGSTLFLEPHTGNARVSAADEPDEADEAESSLEVAGASWFLDPVWDKAHPVGSMVATTDLRRIVMGKNG